MLRRSLLRFSPSKVVSMEKAVGDIHNGAHMAVGGFGCAGVPDAIIQAIKKSGVKDLSVYTDSAGTESFGLGRLMTDNQIKRIVCSYVGVNKLFTKRYLEGDIELEFCPQGTLAECMRSGGCGVPAFYTATAYGTQRQTGGQIIKYDKQGQPCMVTPPKETRCFNGRWYVLEDTVRPHFAIVKAAKADTSGNLVFRGTARNFNVPAAMCGRTTIVEAEQIVETGEIHPDDVHLPGVFVQRIVEAKYEVPIEKRTVRPSASEGAAPAKAMSPEEEVRQRIARRAALEFQDGMYANLGIGIPTEAANYIPPGVAVQLQSENGLLGMGPFPTEDKVHPDWINAGKQTISFLPGASIFDSAISFGMIRGGHMSITMLGALEVAGNGDLANWCIPGKLVKGPGGAMDLVSSGSRVVVTMTHCTKKGEPKIFETCRLPVTGLGCVSRIITEMAVFDIENGQLVLKEVAEGVTVEQVKACTAAHFTAPNVKTMPLAPPLA